MTFPRIHIRELRHGEFVAELPDRKLTPVTPPEGTAEWYEAELFDFVKSMTQRQES